MPDPSQTPRKPLAARIATAMKHAGFAVSVAAPMNRITAHILRDSGRSYVLLLKFCAAGQIVSPAHA